MQTNRSGDRLLAAQLCAVIAFIISMAGWWLSWVAGLLAMIILLLACCIDMHRNLFGAAAVFAIIAAVGEFLVAAGVVEYSVFACENDCLISIDNALILSIVAGVLWCIVAMTANDYGC